MGKDCAGQAYCRARLEIALAFAGGGACEVLHIAYNGSDRIVRAGYPICLIALPFERTSHVPVFAPAVTDAIYDAFVAPAARACLCLGLQHMFAMFGATVLVPVLTGLSVSATLLFAGIGTLLFHFLSRGKVPAFLGSSFAFIAGYAAIAPNGEAELLPYACLGVACAGLLYPVLAALFRAFWRQACHAFLPAGGDWPHRHFHRLDPGKLCHC